MEEDLDHPCIPIVDSIRCTAADDTVIVQMKIPGAAPGEYTKISVHFRRGSGEFLYAFGDVFRDDVFQGYSAYRSGGDDATTHFPVYTH
jgi:hypothetical protein